MSQQRWNAVVWAILILCGIGTIVSAIVGVLFRINTVSSGAMEPTVPEGSAIVVRIGRSIDRGDLVVYRSPVDGTALCHRAIALAGDTIAIRDKQVILNGKPLAEPYVQFIEDAERVALAPTKVPEEHVFVLGDNRDNANDSRYIGAIPRENITGRVVLMLSQRGFTRP